jgi:hypothetical protein
MRCARAAMAVVLAGLQKFARGALVTKGAIC